MSAGFIAEAAILVVLAAAPLCKEIPIDNSHQYRNADYQFSVTIPTGMRGCMTSPPCPNHGAWIPLKRGASCARTQSDSPFMSIYADYNAAGDADTAKGVAALQCRWGSARHIEWLSGERLGDRNAAGCRQYFADGRVSLWITTLRKTDGPVWEWIAVSANLETTAQRYDSDMRVFRRVLRTVWIHPDGPHR